MIHGEITGAESAQANISARAQRIVEQLQRKIFKLLLQLQAKIQGNLAAGIGLKSRHGTAGLAGSVRVVEPVTEGTQVFGEVQGAGGPFWYGAMWERTGHGVIVPVNKKALSWIANGKRIFRMRVSAQGPRPWMRPPFQEMKPQIIAELESTASQLGKEGTE